MIKADVSAPVQVPSSVQMIVKIKILSFALKKALGIGAETSAFIIIKFQVFRLV